MTSCDRTAPIALGDPLPSAAPYPAELEARIRTAAAEEAPEDRLRVRHRRADGSPRFTNRLVLERSTYLRQHAHNPVDWYPWGDEAFARAKTEGKLVLLSIGYATCHWCHVMEEESFEDEAIAARINGDYIAIKVDREERPDVDGTYLRAVTLLTGNAGWPMTVWMTADREVVFAGTYFPPRDGMRGSRRGLLSLLEHFAAEARSDPAALVADGRALATRLEATAEVVPSRSVSGRAVLDAAFARFAAAFDREHGGFGGAPKFPMPSVLDFLLRYHRRTQVPAALAMVEQTLAAMASGGVRDQVGGGFHRYATDAAWGVPHFEKMLYDNAQLATVYLAAWQATGREEWREVTRGILDDLARTFRAPEGGFYSALDADDPVGEGAYYTWTGPEIDAVLGDESARAVRSRWGVSPPGDLDGRSVLRVARAWADVARDIGGDTARAMSLVAGAGERLLAARALRPRPSADAKILAGWNGLAIGAFARAGAAFGEPRYVSIARDAATFLVDRMTTERGVARMYARGGVGQQAGFLEDHTFLIAGLLDLFEATAEVRWLEVAERLQAVVDREFWDGAAGGYFESGQMHDVRLLRSKPWDDGALPSGNALAVDDLVRLAVFRDDDQWRRRAGECLMAVGGTLAADPTMAPRMLGALEAYLDRMWEVVVVSPPGRRDQNRTLAGVVQSTYLPNRAFVSAAEGDELEALRGAVAFVGEKTAIGGMSTAYVCERGRCLAPTSDPETLRRQLGMVVPLPEEAAVHD